MSRRGTIALGIVALWALTLAWHLKRELFRPLEAVVIEGAATLPPGSAYYLVLLDGRRVGWAASELDTLPERRGFLLRDRLEAELPVAGSATSAAVRTEARLGPDLRLLEFAVRSAEAPPALEARGEMEGDSVLEVAVRRGTRSDSLRLRVSGPVMLAAALPLRLAAEPGIRAGDRFRFPLFDPVGLSSEETEVRVLERGIRVFPDSATTDSAGRWVPARRDTVEAWLVEHRVGGIPVSAWMDEDGRIVEARLGGGLVLRRTAFELAFFGGGRRGGGPPPSRGEKAP